MSITLGLAENYAMLGNTYLGMKNAGTVKGFMGSNFLSYSPVPGVDSNGIALDTGTIPNTPIVNGAAAKQAIANVNTAIVQYRLIPAIPTIPPLNTTYNIPGRYTISGNLTLTTDITLIGSETDIYVFDVTGDIITPVDPPYGYIILNGILPQNVIFIAGGTIFIGSFHSTYGIYISTGSNAVLYRCEKLTGRLISTTSTVSITDSPITAPQFA